MSDRELFYFQNVTFYNDDSSGKIVIHRNNNLFTHEINFIFIIAYAIISASGVISNLLVISAIIFSQVLKVKNYHLVLNLFAADISMCLFSLPFTLYQLLQKHWIFGAIACHVLPCIQATINFALSSTIILIAFDRASKISGRYSNKPQRNRSKAICTCPNRVALIWLTSFILALPCAIFYRQFNIKIGKIVLFRRCLEDWPEYVKLCYTIITLFMSLVLPFICLLACNMRILRFLGKQNHLNQTISSIDCKGKKETRLVRTESVRYSRNHRAIISLRRILFTFVISWLPLNLITLYVDFTTSSRLSSKSLYFLLLIAHLIAASSSTSNALLYGIMNTNIKRELIYFKRKWLTEIHTDSRQPSSPRLTF